MCPDIMDGNKSPFDVVRDGTGVSQWAEHSFNFGIGCSHNCKYGYCRANALRFGMIKKASDWEKERIKYGIRKVKFSKKSGVIMTPTVTDITPYYLSEAIIAFRGLLEVGNHLLIVSKPHIFCVKQIIANLDRWRDQVMFRFTIGTTDEKVARFWESGAPEIAERMECLMFAKEMGWRTSVSGEPLLGGYDTAVALVAAVEPYVTDTIWLGKLNQIRQRVDCTERDTVIRVQEIERLQRDSEILRLHDALRDNEKVRWKESISKIVNRLEGA